MTPGPSTTRGIQSRRLLIIPAVFILVVAAVPWLSELYEQRGWPLQARAFTTEVTVSGLTLLMGWWIITLIRREQRYSMRHLAELERLTLTDPLTGLGNRRALERDLPRALRLSERIDVPVALLYMDIDRFKQINDLNGHAVGDDTLRVLGAVLRSCSRAGTDVAYRVGGDEFVMSLVADRAGAEVVAHRAAQDFFQRSPRHSSVSFGVVVWDGKVSASMLMDQADTRMYQSRFGRAWASEPEPVPEAAPDRRAREVARVRPEGGRT
jgi:diguanylate cyclase (GGDEF)-like protein